MAEPLQSPHPLPWLPGQEPLEDEPIGRQPGHDERADRGRGAGNDLHVDTCVDAGSDEAIPGIGHGRRPTVGHERDVVTVAEPLQEPADPFALVALEVREQGHLDLQPGQQPAGPAGVLAGDEVHLPEHLARTRRQIAQVADRGRDEPQRSTHGSRVTRCAASAHGRKVIRRGAVAEGHKDYSSTPTWKKLGIRPGFSGRPRRCARRIPRAPRSPGTASTCGEVPRSSDEQDRRGGAVHHRASGAAAAIRRSRPKPRAIGTALDRMAQERRRGSRPIYRSRLCRNTGSPPGWWTTRAHPSPTCSRVASS
ncbi:hypothetical protein BH18ACT17_BH18ACT17_04340 [soil metagenome]